MGLKKRGIHWDACSIFWNTSHFFPFLPMIQDKIGFTLNKAQGHGPYHNKGLGKLCQNWTHSHMHDFGKACNLKLYFTLVVPCFVLEFFNIFLIDLSFKIQKMMDTYPCWTLNCKKNLPNINLHVKKLEFVWSVFIERVLMQNDSPCLTCYTLGRSTIRSLVLAMEHPRELP